MAPRKITKGRCHVCRHVDRARIEFARISGVSLDNIAATFPGITRDMVWAHMRAHVSTDQRALYLADVDLADLAKKANAEQLSLLDYLAITRSCLMLQMQAAAGCHDRSGTAQLAGKLNQTLDMIGRITGEMLRLAPGAVVNNTTIFLNSPMFVDLQSMLMRKLQGHPEALGRVVEGLQELEARVAPVAASPAPASNGATTPSPPEPAHG